MQLDDTSLKLIAVGHYYPTFLELQKLADELLYRRNCFQLTVCRSRLSSETETEYIGSTLAQA